MLKLIFIQPRRAQEPFLLRWQPHRAGGKKKRRRVSSFASSWGILSQRQSQVAAATTAWESQRAIWKAKWVIDDRSQLSPRGSVRGGRLCGASVTHRPPLTNHQQVRTPAQPDGKTLATEYMTGRTYTAITSARSYGGEETPLVFPLRLHSIAEANLVTARQN